MQDFGKYELETIERALRALTSRMRESAFVGDDDPHLAKCDAVHAKVKAYAKGGE